MTPLPRHQCLIYDGAPSRNLSALAAIIKQKLRLDYRCLYLNSAPMVAGMRSYLAAAGLNVAEEEKKGTLELSSDQMHLVDGGRFDPELMIRTLEGAIDRALSDGLSGLWATGDMSWEFGPHKDFSKLVEYERLLEDLFRRRAELGGICQYHAATLPPSVLRKGLLMHRGLFISETLSVINPHYLEASQADEAAPDSPELDRFLGRLGNLEIAN